MASVSNYAVKVGRKSLENKLSLALSDCICPVCMCILIEPVTMPCQHELCMACFQLNVREANLTCPLCRLRISTWTRKATRNNKLVNQKRWQAIQTAFPHRVQNRIEGKEDDLSSDEELPVVLQHIAAPGEIREEYEKEMQKIEEEHERLRLEEEEASRSLISKLQEEEEHQRQEAEILQSSDQALAKQLMEELTRDSAASPRSDTSRKSTFLDKFLARSKDVSMSPSDKNFWQASSAMSLDGSAKSSSDTTFHPMSVSASPGSCVCFGSRTNSGIGEFDEMMEASEIMNMIGSVKRKSSSGLSCVSDHVEALVSRSATVMPARWKTRKKTETVSHHRMLQRSSSSGSTDSITPELVHFKPIHASPKTPPQRLPGGRVIDPPIILSTPRNLSTIGSRRDAGSPMSDDEATDNSPIMHQRLKELAMQRKARVAALSKATGPEVPLLPILRDHSYSSPKKSEKLSSKSLRFGKGGAGEGCSYSVHSVSLALSDAGRHSPRPGPSQSVEDSDAPYSILPLESKIHEDVDLHVKQVEDGIYVEETPCFLQKQRSEDEGTEDVTQEVITNQKSGDLDENESLLSNVWGHVRKYIPFVTSPVRDKYSKSVENTDGSHEELSNEQPTLNEGLNNKHKGKLRKQTPREHRPEAKDTEEWISEKVMPKRKVQGTLGDTTRVASQSQRRRKLLEGEGNDNVGSENYQDYLGRSREEGKIAASSTNIQKQQKKRGRPRKAGQPDLECTVKPGDSSEKDLEEQISRKGQKCKKFRSDSDSELHKNVDKKSNDNDSVFHADIKVQQRRQSRKRRRTVSDSECNGRNYEVKMEVNKVLHGLKKRGRSTEDKENELDNEDGATEPPQITRNKGGDPVEESELSGNHDLQMTPKKSRQTQQQRHAVEYTPSADGKKRKVKSRVTRGPKKQTKAGGKQTKLQFVTSVPVKSGGGDSQRKLVFTRGGSRSSSSSSSTRTKHPQHSRSNGKRSYTKARAYGKSEESGEDTESEDEEDEADEEPVPPCQFASEEERRAYMEEQDRLLAVQLQADFDLEAKLRLNVIRRKGSEGEYEFRSTRKKVNYQSFFNGKAATRSSR